MTAMCCFSSSMADAQLARQLRHLVILQQPQVLGHDPLGRRPLQAEVPDLQPEALLEVARGNADRVECLHHAQHPLHLVGCPPAHRRDLVHRRHQVAVVVQVADDGRPDLPAHLVVRLDGELPEEVVGQRGRGGEGVLDRRELLDFLRRPRPVPVVEIVAEEILVVLVVPGIGLLLLGWLLGLLGHGGRLGLHVLGRNLLEQRVLDHLLRQQFAQFEGGHRQQLDRLLQRWRENELLDELRVKFLLNRHARGSVPTQS